jgi:hypothetical protein
MLRFREEKENLPDVVWLATSGNELRALWSKVTTLLGDQPTQLERDALAILPQSTNPGRGLHHPVLLAFPQYHSIRAACRRSASQSSKRVVLTAARVRSSSRAR